MHSESYWHFAKAKNSSASGGGERWPTPLRVRRPFPLSIARLMKERKPQESAQVTPKLTLQLGIQIYFVEMLTYE